MPRKPTRRPLRSTTRNEWKRWLVALWWLGTSRDDERDKAAAKHDHHLPVASPSLGHPVAHRGARRRAFARSGLRQGAFANTWARKSGMPSEISAAGASGPGQGRGFAASPAAAYQCGTPPFDWEIRPISDVPLPALLASFYGLENVPGLARQGPIPDSASDVVYYSEKSSFIHGGCANTVLIGARSLTSESLSSSGTWTAVARTASRSTATNPSVDAAHEDSELAAIQRILSRDEDSQERARPPGWEVLRHDGCRCSTWTETHGGWAVGVVEEELDIVSCLRGLDAVESLEQLARVDEGEFAEARGEWEQRGSGGGSGRKEEANGRRAVTISQMM
ncbi:hypothetical protein B0H17DRAFT_1151392 [Mycena rosella]|uniref:Uncharacterized protein n=1 Tax=Mycena rosella TaxID=1033263 RepID=A0AAD7BKQ9_MYCRO|nr:hypothetical protein B0H17DRAFT_1151392 [Mycena rosella]